MMLEKGIKGHEEELVTMELTASHIGSGTVRVLATPMMIALMEKTSRISVKPYLEEGEETVGIHVNVSHVASTPIGKKVWCDTELIDIDRRRLVFKVAVYNDNGLVERGHTNALLSMWHVLRPRMNSNFYLFIYKTEFVKIEYASSASGKIIP